MLLKWRILPSLQISSYCPVIMACSYFTISQEPLYPTETKAVSSLGLCISKHGVWPSTHLPPNLPAQTYWNLRSPPGTAVWANSGLSLGLTWGQASWSWEAAVQRVVAASSNDPKSRDGRDCISLGKRRRTTPPFPFCPSALPALNWSEGCMDGREGRREARTEEDNTKVLGMLIRPLSQFRQ